MAEEQVERRLAAILAAEVVGYSRLMERDEAGTMALLRARRQDVLMPLVARQGGRVFKVMGDGVLIEFTSVVNAVADALARAGKGHLSVGLQMPLTSRVLWEGLQR